MKQLKRGNVLLAVMALCISAAIIFPILHYTSVRFIRNTAITLDEGWNLDINGKDYGEVTLSTYTFPMTNRGDVLTLTKRLDKNAIVINPILKCYSIHSVVEAYLNNAMIYSYGRDEYENNKLIGYGYQYIPLLDGYEGHELKLVFTVAEDSAFSGFQAMEIGDERTMLQMSMTGDRMRLAVSLFLIVFGIIGCVVTTLATLRNRKFMRLFCVALFSLLIGCWTLCNNDMINYFTQDLLVKVYMEYLCIYAVPLPLLWYFYDRVMNQSRPPAIRIGYWCVLGVQTAFFLLAIIGQIMNVFHLPAILNYAHGLMAADLAFIVILAVDSVRSRKKFNRGLQIGMAIVMAFTLVELVRYNVEKYFMHFQANRYNSALCFGALIVVVTLLCDYTSQITRGLYQMAQQQLLERMAYSDELTGLYNRRRCDECVKELIESKKSFIIFSMDLNLLKFYNDNYGHDKGDELLKHFADVLQEAFPDPIVKARVGGDEFMAVAETDQDSDVEKMIERFHNTIDESNKKIPSLKISCALGYVDRNEFGDQVDVNMIYNAADYRMYENKRRMKEAR